MTRRAPAPWTDEVTVQTDTVLEIVVPRRLQSANTYLRQHWTRRHHETQAWEVAIAAAIGPARAAWNLILATQLRRTRAGRAWTTHYTKRHERRRVTIVRRVPRVADLITDADNLDFAVKPLMDALTRLGLIVDDSAAWVDRATLTQQVTGWSETVIRIERGMA
jgi:hypothetical protein